MEASFFLEDFLCGCKECSHHLTLERDPGVRKEIIKIEWNESSSEDTCLSPQTIQGTQTAWSNLIAKVR